MSTQGVQEYTFNNAVKDYPNIKTTNKRPEINTTGYAGFPSGPFKIKK